MFLSGAVVDTYFARSLRQGGADTLGVWTEQDIVDFLMTGANPHGIVFRSIIAMIVHSTQYMTADDAFAIAKYLKAVIGSGGTVN